MLLKQTVFYQEFSKLSLHRKIYILGLMILVIGLPLSPFLVSISQFIIGLNWIFEQNFKEKFTILKNNKAIWAFLILPLLHLLWLLNTSDFHYALHDLKIKLPLLLFPIFIGTSNPLSKKEIKWVLYIFIASVFIATTVSLAVLTGLYHIEYYDIRAVSVFISHIRFGLMILLSLLITGYYFGQNFNGLSTIKIVGICLLMAWFLIFLVILQSITSWVAFVIVAFYVFAKNYKKIQQQIVRRGIWASIILFILFSGGVIAKVYYDFYFSETYDLKNLPQYTPHGNKYYNDPSSIYKENGHYIKILICYKELKETWPELSKVPYNGKDANGYPIVNTMIRYLASKGLPRDRDGLLALDQEDVKMIEDGYASCIDRMKFIPYVKMYNVLWEIDRYQKSGDANNKSIVQRIEFGKTAIHIIKNNFWFGIGTGDLSIEYNKAYKEIKSNLKEKNRLRAHNQFLTFFVTFGVFGFILAVFSMLYPAIQNKNMKNNLLLSGFIIIILISMLNEDTLETQAGVTFYIAFYTIFLFSKFRE